MIGDNQELNKQYLTCMICLDLAKNALNCEDCNNLMCGKCYWGLDNRDVCPTCKKENISIQQNILAQRMIGSLVQTCPNNCGEESTIDNMERHILVCRKRIIKCTECQNEFKKDEFTDHLWEYHEQQVIEKFGESKRKVQSKQSVILGNGDQDQDKICTRTNAYGRKARLGYQGKYYCVADLETFCGCCDGHCGPTNGCNCVACMSLDIKARSLPKGYLVNREGRIARRGTNGAFYCGCEVLQGVFGCDGWCGPTNGPACRSCQILDQQVERYKSLL